MNFGIWEMLIILAIVALIFGTAKLKNIGSDVGGALKGFRHALNDDTDLASSNVEDSEPASKSTEKNL